MNLKMWSAKVVYCTYLLTLLTNCTGKQCSPRSDCSYRSSLIWVYTVWLRGLQNISAAENFFCDCHFNFKMNCCFVLFVWFDYVQVNIFSVMSGPVFQDCTSTKQLIKCLAQGRNTVNAPAVRLELANIDLQSNSLPTEPLHSAQKLLRSCSTYLSEDDRLEQS